MLTPERPAPASWSQSGVTLDQLKSLYELISMTLLWNTSELKVDLTFAPQLKTDFLCFLDPTTSNQLRGMSGNFCRRFYIYFWLRKKKIANGIFIEIFWFIFMFLYWPQGCKFFTQPKINTPEWSLWFSNTNGIQSDKNKNEKIVSTVPKMVGLKEINTVHWIDEVNSMTYDSKR